MPTDKKHAYEVGYGKPPRHTRFIKGQSGNPRGRPPGAKNLKALLSEALNETVIVTENGGCRKVTKRQAVARGARHVDVGGPGDCIELAGGILECGGSPRQKIVGFPVGRRLLRSH